MRKEALQILESDGLADHFLDALRQPSAEIRSDEIRNEIGHLALLLLRPDMNSAEITDVINILYRVDTEDRLTFTAHAQELIQSGMMRNQRRL